MKRYFMLASFILARLSANQMSLLACLKIYNSTLFQPFFCTHCRFTFEMTAFSISAIETLGVLKSLTIHLSNTPIMPDTTNMDSMRLYWSSIDGLIFEFSATTSE